MFISHFTCMNNFSWSETQNIKFHLKSNEHKAEYKEDQY